RYRLLAPPLKKRAVVRAKLPNVRLLYFEATVQATSTARERPDLLSREPTEATESTDDGHAQTDYRPPRNEGEPLCRGLAPDRATREHGPRQLSTEVAAWRFPTQAPSLSDGWRLPAARNSGSWRACSPRPKIPRRSRHSRS